MERRARRLGAARHPGELGELIEVRLARATRQLRENVNPQLALENVLLHLPAAS
jgi:hypothetical protein